MQRKWAINGNSRIPPITIFHHIVTLLFFNLVHVSVLLCLPVCVTSSNVLTTHLTTPSRPIHPQEPPIRCTQVTVQKGQKT